MIARSFFDQWSLDHRSFDHFLCKIDRMIDDRTTEFFFWSNDQLIERPLIEKWSCDHDHFCYYDRMVVDHSINFQKKWSYDRWSSDQLSTMIADQDLDRHSIDWLFMLLRWEYFLVNLFCVVEWIFFSSLCSLRIHYRMYWIKIRIKLWGIDGN